MSLRNEKDLNTYKNEYESVNMSEESYQKMVARMKQAKKEKLFMKNRNSIKGFVAAAAAAVVMILPNISPMAAYAMSNIPVLGGFFKVITIREYNYEDDYKQADINVVEVSKVGDKELDGEVAENAHKSMNEINSEIKALAEKWEAEFKADMESEGYHNVSVTSEVVNTTGDYFTLKIECFEAAASGAETDYYYTIDLKSGNRVALSDLFKDGSDYNSVIVKNIEDQMRALSAADENNIFWLDDELMDDWSVAKALENASFYINSNNEVVISFNEGEVGPMYMGVVEFVLPDSAIGSIRR